MAFLPNFIMYSSIQTSLYLPIQLLVVDEPVDGEDSLRICTAGYLPFERPWCGPFLLPLHNRFLSGRREWVEFS